MPFCEVKKLPSIYASKGLIISHKKEIRDKTLLCFLLQFFVDIDIRGWGIKWYSSFVGKLED